MENKITKCSALIYYKGAYIGSGVIFAQDSELYLITAGHNIYGTDFSSTLDLPQLAVVDFWGISHSVEQVFGDRECAVQSDIISLRLKCSSKISDFLTPVFSTMPMNPSHSMMFRAKIDSAVSPVLHRNIYYNNKGIQVNQFLCKIDKSLLINHHFKSGASWLGGWSGSGLFYENGSKLICSGILIEIPNKGNDGQILFSSLTGLSNTGFAPDLIDSGDLDFDEVFSASSLREILLQITKESVEQWERENKGSDEVENLNRKVGNIYPTTSFNRQKQRIITALMTGRAYVSTELQKQDILNDVYERSYLAYGLADMEFSVQNQSEALKRFQEITADYKAVLNRALQSKLHSDDISVLIQHGISEWVAKCSIDFIIP